MTRLDDYIAGLLSEDMAWEGDAEQAEQLERCRRELVEVLGFTREDLALLRKHFTDDVFCDVSKEDAVRGTDLADRIEALLPPEEAA